MIRRAFLLVVLPIIFGYTLGYSLTGCGPFVDDVKDAKSEADKTSSLLKKCRGEARAEYYVGQKSVEQSLEVYEACKRREGVQ